MAHGNIRPKAVSVKDILVWKEGERTGCSFYYSIFWYFIYYVVIWETVSQNRKISLSQCIVKKNILFLCSWIRHGTRSILGQKQNTVKFRLVKENQKGVKYINLTYINQLINVDADICYLNKDITTSLTFFSKEVGHMPKNQPTSKNWEKNCVVSYCFFLHTKRVTSLCVRLRQNYFGQS